MSSEQLEQFITQLRRQLVNLGGIAEYMVRDSIESVVERNSDLAQRVIKRDDEADLLENNIREKCIHLMAKPTAKLKEVQQLMVINDISRNLERVADKAVNISKRSLELTKSPPIKPYIDLPVMAEKSQKMLKDVIDAFVNRDLVMAKNVVDRDAEVDSLYDQMVDEIQSMLENERKVRPSISLLLVIRHLERIADLAANIGEDIYYLIDGRLIRHQKMSTSSVPLSTIPNNHNSYGVVGQSSASKAD